MINQTRALISAAVLRRRRRNNNNRRNNNTVYLRDIYYIVYYFQFGARDIAAAVHYYNTTLWPTTVLLSLSLSLVQHARFTFYVFHLFGEYDYYYVLLLLRRGRPTDCWSADAISTRTMDRISYTKTVLPLGPSASPPLASLSRHGRHGVPI